MKFRLMVTLVVALVLVSCTALRQETPASADPVQGDVSVQDVLSTDEPAELLPQSTPPEEKPEEPVPFFPYVMAFHACDTAIQDGCMDPRNHQVYLAVSEDGEHWSLDPSWVSYQGSVPDVIRRGNTLYIYSAGGNGQLVRYHLDSGVIDPPVRVSLQGSPEGFVDPSVFRDENSLLHLFFLPGQMGMDPAGCAPGESSCVREIRSASEVPGSDGEQFVLVDGSRLSMTIDPSSDIKSLSDPDIFHDGRRYILYTSHGPSTAVWVSPELHGSYELEPSLPGGMLAYAAGGVPAGYYDSGSQRYWTYVSVTVADIGTIQQAVHSDFSRGLQGSDFSPVITGDLIELGEAIFVGSPGFDNSMAAGFFSPGGETAAAPDAHDESMEPMPENQGGPEFNPFENMTVEQQACLLSEWGDEVFQQITGFQRPPSPAEEQAMMVCLGDPFKPQDSDQGMGHDPSADQVYLAFSVDGLTWPEGTLLADHASVPDVLRREDGSVWAYWVDFSEFDGAASEQIGVARSPDEGNSWEMMGPVSFSGLDSIVPVDPDVVELPDGRLRMYFYDITTRESAHPIYSAVSSDGINFVKEEGTRLVMDQVYDPDVVVLPGGSYRMYLNQGDIVSAFSVDGLVFEEESGVRVREGSVPGSIVMQDGSIRMYNCAGGLSVYSSMDGLVFGLVRQGLVHAAGSEGAVVCDPSITAIPGGYLMVYKAGQVSQVAP